MKSVNFEKNIGRVLEKKKFCLHY